MANTREGMELNNGGTKIIACSSSYDDNTAANTDCGIRSQHDAGIGIFHKIKSSSAVQ